MRCALSCVMRGPLPDARMRRPVRGLTLLSRHQAPNDRICRSSNGPTERATCGFVFIISHDMIDKPRAERSIRVVACHVVLKASAGLGKLYDRFFVLAR
jgi:hypothetical protein